MQRGQEPFGPVGEGGVALGLTVGERLVGYAGGLLTVARAVPGEEGDRPVVAVQGAGPSRSSGIARRGGGLLVGRRGFDAPRPGRAPTPPARSPAGGTRRSPGRRWRPRPRPDLRT